ncbi:uncharacterized protein LOC135930930 [Gordionus sp. m RMFG-2023]|uniref:uncharacterized protein LOC135924476 n=2 Tax=Gordionus sp. m RMFG-2023 TaxID=3053472 RepID=UPI0031FCB4E1
MKKNSLISNFFLFDQDNIFATCSSCHKKLKSIPSNLKRHIFSQHPNIAANLNSNEVNNLDISTSSSQSNEKTSQTIKIVMSKSKVYESVVGLIAINNLPINLVTYESFKLLLDPIVQSLNMTLNKHIVNDKIKYAASEIRCLIMQQVKNKLISLKIDTATRFQKSVLGVNAQFIIDDKIEIRTLGMLEIVKAHTASNLKEEIENLLKKYNICLSQIYSITVDNGANMIKTVEMIAEEQLITHIDLSEDAFSEYLLQNSDNESSQEYNDSSQPNNDYNNIEITQENNSDISNIHDNDSSGEYIINNLNQDDNIHFQHDNQEQINDDMENLLNDLRKSFGLICVRCCAHTIQLGVNDYIKKFLKEDLEDIRSILKICKSQKYKSLYSLEKINKPVLDTVTRWNSTYRMLKNLKDNKIFYLKMGHIYLETFINSRLWDRIDAYLTVLSPVNLCTIKLQEKSCTIGDFFKLWLECKLDLEEINNESSNNLINCLDYRQKYLFDNNVFRSGIYMDPRFNYQNGIYPSESDKLLAREHLMSTWRQIQIFNKPKDNPALSGSPLIPVSCKKTRLDVYLERESANAPIYQNIEILDMKTKINALIYGQKLPSDQNILQYWQSKKFQDPELYALSRVVLAAPCSQVSVERSFSALGLVLTPLRTRLEKSILNDILLIKLNKSVLNNVIF